jgi:hypothetical protein
MVELAALTIRAVSIPPIEAVAKKTEHESIADPCISIEQLFLHIVRFLRISSYIRFS